MVSSPRPNSVEKNNESRAIDGPRTARRARVALACQRCKTRKQKCDGERPSCSNCSSFDAVCDYIKPTRNLSTSQDTYFKATEERITELESILVREGIVDEGRPKWQHFRATLQQSDSIEAVEIQRPSKRPHSNSPQPNSIREKHDWDDTSKNQETNTVVDILRDLSLEASGGYIGAASSITLSRMVGSLMKTNESFCGRLQAGEHFSPKSQSDTSIDDTYVDIASIPQDIADKLLWAYLKHISTRWPILHSKYIKRLHARRSSLSTAYERSALHLIYASGGRFLETTGETGAFYCERHHEAGSQHLDEILQYHDVRTVQILILLAIYSLRAPQGPGAWTSIGFAMRTCIDLGMHRRRIPRPNSLLDNEMKKRIFWTCYCLDRQVSIILGRPFAISDREIDVELPLDVDESATDTSDLEAAQLRVDAATASQPQVTSTSLSCFIHICHLRRIESQIQQCIYRVDQRSGASEIEVESFIQQLEDWKEKIPQDARQHPGDKPSETTDTMVIDGYGYYMVYYYKCLRFLLHPLLSAPKAHLRFILKCAEACGGVCQTYKKLHQGISVGFSLMALHSVFLAGKFDKCYCGYFSKAHRLDFGLLRVAITFRGLHHQDIK
jgi:hypothetical protein